MDGAQAHLLEDGKRLHLHHGPIDLIVEAFGAGRDAGYEIATRRFQTILEELADELTLLRKRASVGRTFRGSVACRMQNAVEPYCAEFVTPMAAVAGAVADEILACVQNANGIRKAYVNNGGDAAFYLNAGETIKAAMAGQVGGLIEVGHETPFRGIATSGWRGRSFSLGVADTVSIVAHNAACADVAATMVANAVTVPNCPRITRLPADELLPDSDLGSMMVTTEVAELYPQEVTVGLDNGHKAAVTLLKRGLIGGAVLCLQGDTRHVGLLADQLPTPDNVPTRMLTDA